MCEPPTGRALLVWIGCMTAVLVALLIIHFSR